MPRDLFTVATETATNDASKEGIVDKKDPVQAKQEQFDESKEDSDESEDEPSEVHSADDKDEDEDPVEERDEGNMLQKWSQSP